jgi:uncharacterized membrane protein YgcG
MIFIRRRFVFFAFVAAIVACSSQSATVPAAHGSQAAPSTDALLPLGQSRDVAAVGSSEEGLAQSIKAAESEDLVPDYLLLRGPKRAYYFSTLAQVVRTDHALAIRDYGRTYVFPIASVSLEYHDVAVAPISAEGLPRVRAPHIESFTAAFSGADDGTTDQFRGQMASFKASLCPDCSEVLISAETNHRLLRDWHAATNSWHASTLAVTPYAAHPAFIPCDTCDPGSSSSSSGSGGGTGGGSAGGGGGGGGTGGGTVTNKTGTPLGIGNPIKSGIEHCTKGSTTFSTTTTFTVPTGFGSSPTVALCGQGFCALDHDLTPGQTVTFTSAQDYTNDASGNDINMFIIPAGGTESPTLGSIDYPAC